jgi:hypothetical protein
MPGNHIRNFMKFFTNLVPSQRQEFERAINELQDFKELSSLENSLDLLRRKPDQSLPIPQVDIQNTIRGGVVTWDPLPDQRVNFYEVDIATTNNFAAPDTVSTFGLEAVIDGLTSSVFVRVRGVRRDGTTTPYSETQTISPELFDIKIRSDEDFYIPIVGTSANTILGGDGSELDYVPININGNSMVWGFITTYGDPAVAMLGLDDINAELKVRVIDDDSGTVLSEETVWKHSIGDFWSSQAIGPIVVQHPNVLNQGIEIRLDITDSTTGVDNDGIVFDRTGDRTEVYWGHLSAMELGASND